LLSIIYTSALFVVITSIFFLLTLLLWKYGHLIFSLVTNHANFSEKRGEYEVSPARDYILKKTEKGYYASKFLEIKFYESSLERGKEGTKIMFDAFEKAIISLRNVVKISLLISSIDLSKHIDDIKTLRSVAESKKSQVSSSKTNESAKIDRKISMYNKDLDRLSKGERAVEVVAYATTTAFGITKDDALTRVKRQSKEIVTILSSTLGCSVVELSDLDMLRCFEWDKFIPASGEDLKDEIF